MKTKITTFLLCLLLVNQIPLLAQVTIGTNNATPLRFVTNSVERGRITATGFWGVGTSSPGAKLDLRDATGGLLARFNGGNNMWMGLYENGAYRGYFGSYSGAAADVDFGTGAGTIGNLHLTIQATPRLTISNQGNVGIGTTVPNAKLDIKNSAAGLLARFDGGNSLWMGLYENGTYRGYLGSYAGAADDVDFGTGAGTTGKLHLTIQASPRLTINNQGNVGIGTTEPQQKLHVDGNEILSTGNLAGFKFRNRGATTTADDWVWYSQDNIARFWRQGTGDLLGITTGGNVGIGNTAPGGYKLKVSHGLFGLNIENASNKNDWELVTGTTLRLYYNGVFKGAFSTTTGAYTRASDGRLKTNIQPMPAVLDKINQLKPATYQFKVADKEVANANPEYGFIAQEVIKTFPHLVTHNVDSERQLEAYTVDYSGFGVIAIKGIQELQKTIQQQQQLIQQQQQEIATFQNRLAKIEAALNLNPGGIKPRDPDFSGISLEQNEPNPATENTTFRYSIPAGTMAQIKIYESVSGKLLKSLPAPANGQVQISANQFQPGTYIYSLEVQGKVVASKKMVISR